MAETKLEQNLFKLSLNPLQDYFSIDIGQIDQNGLEVEKFCEKNGILDHLDTTHKIDILKQFIQCLRRLYLQSMNGLQLSSSQISRLGNQLSVSDKSERTNDIHSLANIYCSVLTNEKWQNYSEELPMEDIQYSDPVIALDILRVMAKDSTTDTKEIFLHPFYWSDVRKVDFICNAADLISSKKGKEQLILLQNFVIPDNGWIASLELTAEERRYIMKNNKDLKIGTRVIMDLVQKYDKRSVWSLMRFFRNRYLHRFENVERVTIAFGGYPAGYLRFFTSRFPNLLMHVYWNMKNIYLDGDTNIEQYFVDDWTTPVELPHSSVKEASPDVLPSKARNSFPRSPPPPYSRYENTKEKTFREESSGPLKEPQTNLFYFAQRQDIQQGEISSCQSKSVNIPVKEEHVYSDCTLSNVELIEIENIVKYKSEVDMIEFCDCKIGNDYCKLGESKKKTAKCKISKLIISFTDHFEEFFRFFDSTFGGCEIKSLCLLYDNLDDQDVDNLQRFMVKGIENLDLSYNKKISPDGFKQIGNIIAEQGIKTLKAMNCDLEKTKLEKLFEGLKNVNLRELDIGYNDKLTENGFEMLAKLVASRGIETLKLRGCQLTEKTIQVFYNTLEKTDEKVLLNELDLSYNPKMNPEGCEILGLIIKKFGTTILNLAGCGISEEHLKSLMSMKDIEVNAINLRDNSYPDNNMVEIANIVREFKIQELDISDCMFSARKLRNFRTDLNGTKLQKLHLGDKSCELGMEYIQEVCQLLPTVKETLYLRFHRLDNSCRRLLKEKSENLSVSIQLCEEPQVTLDK